MGHRLKELRKWKGWTISEAAAALGYSFGGYTKLEARESLKTLVIERAAQAYGVSPAVVMGLEPITPNAPTLTGNRLPPSNALVGGPVDLTGDSETIPVYGQAMGGEDGEFIFNGSRLADILAPPILRGVTDAYAVYVMGESMEPRYFAGEVVYVHPHLPVRRSDFVIAQVQAHQAGDAPHGFIKQFISRSSGVVRLRQFNPDRNLEFPASEVVSIHRIVGSGEPR